MNRQKTLKLAMSAMFCALVFAMTWISVPAPAAGNVNLGDGMLLLCAWLLSGPWAAIAAAAGAALADLSSGYIIYAPATFVIKACMVLVAIALLQALERVRLPKLLCRILSSVGAELTMILGYFVYEAWILAYGVPVAAANILFNSVQGAVAILLANLAYPLLRKIELLRRSR